MMNKKIHIIIIALLSFIVLSSCKGEGEEVEPSYVPGSDPTSFKVELLTFGGTFKQPLDFTNEYVPVSLRITALDEAGEKLPYSGHLKLYSTTGELDGASDDLEMTDGYVDSHTALIRLAFGKTHVWVENDSYAVGSTPDLYFNWPTVIDINENETKADTGEEYLATWRKKQVKSRSVPGKQLLVVTAITIDGMFVTDILNPGKKNSIFIFNFNTPSGIARGDVLTEIGGTVFEFAGLFSQLSDPTWVKSDEKVEVPDPISITADMLTDRELMENYESALVKVESVTVANFDVEGDDYLSYKQWPAYVETNGVKGAVKVKTYDSVREFSPDEHIGENIEYIIGNLKHIPQGTVEPKSSWLILVRDPGDFGFSK